MPNRTGRNPSLTQTWISPSQAWFCSCSYCLKWSPELGSTTVGSPALVALVTGNKYLGPSSFSPVRSVWLSLLFRGSLSWWLGLETVVGCGGGRLGVGVWVVLPPNSLSHRIPSRQLSLSPPAGRARPRHPVDEPSPSWGHRLRRPPTLVLSLFLSSLSLSLVWFVAQGSQNSPCCAFVKEKGAQPLFCSIFFFDFLVACPFN